MIVGDGGAERKKPGYKPPAGVKEVDLKANYYLIDELFKNGKKQEALDAVLL